MIGIRGHTPIRVLLCYPFLDLRFLIDAREAPLPPGWPYGGFGTVGSLGSVLAPAGVGREAELRANAAILFPVEYNQGPQKRHGRQWRRAPVIDQGINVSGRRLLADTDGHVRVEITLSVCRPRLDALADLLEDLLEVPVDVVRVGRSELISAGFRLAQAYLRQSAKTAEPTNFRLLDTLLREGAGSPFIVVLWSGPEDPIPDGIPIDPPHQAFSTVTCSLMQLAGHTLGVWQIGCAGKTRRWLPHVRDLCRIICHLSEVTLLAGLQQDPAALTPYLLNLAATESFFRQRAGQLRRKWRGCWYIPTVQALAAQHLRVSIDEETAFIEGLRKMLRRDIAGDIVSTLGAIRQKASEVHMTINYNKK